MVLSTSKAFFAASVLDFFVGPTDCICFLAALYFYSWSPMVFLSKRAGLASLKSSFLGIERAFLA